MFYAEPCASSTARSRAVRRSTGSRACRSTGRSTRTRAARTAARSVTSAPSRRAPTGPPTTATAARSASRSTSPTCSGASSRGRRGSERASRSGAATDPYQPAEGRYRLTRACIEELGRARTPFSIITRGPMIRRDIDVLVEAARRTNVHVSFSVPTLDERIWRTTEPGTAPPRRRLETVRHPDRGGHRHRRRARADPPRALRRSGAPRRGRPRGARAPERRASGRTSSTFDPGPGSTSSRRSHATGPSCFRATSGSTRAAPICPRRRSSPSARRCGPWRARRRGRAVR